MVLQYRDVRVSSGVLRCSYMYAVEVAGAFNHVLGESNDVSLTI